MSDWDEKAISAEFRRKALSAEDQRAYWSGQARQGSMGAEVNHDDALSEFYVYNYLHGKLFLASRRALLAELKEFRDIEQIDTGAFDQDRFRKAHRRIVDSLIDRFEAEQEA